MKYIYTKRGQPILVDDEDYELASQYSWKINKLGYVQAYEKGKSHSTRKQVYLHRLLMVANKGEYIDHRNRNKQDNRRANLRRCTNRQNICNQGLKKSNKSGFKGVSWWDRTKERGGGKGYWKAQIEFKRQVKCLGCFKDRHTAALMYDFWNTFLNKDFAVTNFPIVSIGPTE